MQHIHHLVDQVRTAIFDRKFAVQGIAFHPEFTFYQFLAFAYLNSDVGYSKFCRD